MTKISLPFPLRTRRNIPFFYNKTEAEFRQDTYEDYHEMVMRQSIVHLADDWWEGYPHQVVLDWILGQVGDTVPSKIADIGCGVGRLIGEMAQAYPHSECWGMDYSYQLLRQAYDYWVAGQTIDLDGAKRGLGMSKIVGKRLKNLHFGLAKGESLPFEDGVLDLVCSSFVLDRFESPSQALEEMFRVLKKDGQLLIVSPLNFLQAQHWAQFFPLSRLLEQFQKTGFLIEKVETDLVLREPLDKQGNHVHWKCVGLDLRKG